MNTEPEEFYQDTLLQIGHIGAELTQLLACLQNQELAASANRQLKLQILLHDQVIIEKFRVAELAIVEVRAMATHWVARATGRLQS